uniref:Uncharacterized protein n=1 Tax=Trichogramma kaykai TaxID=54128 RepID=A0ABD2X3S1_9HYME
MLKYFLDEYLEKLSNNVNCIQRVFPALVNLAENKADLQGRMLNNFRFMIDAVDFDPQYAPILLAPCSCYSSCEYSYFFVEPIDEFPNINTIAAIYENSGPCVNESNPVKQTNLFVSNQYQCH